PPPTPPLFPYTTLFRSHQPPAAEPAGRLQQLEVARAAAGEVQRQPVEGGRCQHPQGVAEVVEVAGHQQPRPWLQTPEPLVGTARSEEHTSELQSRSDLV